MRQYTIARFPIQIFGEGLDSLPGFNHFLSGNPVGKPLLIINTEVELRDWNIPPAFASEYERVYYDFSVRDNVYLFRMKQPDDNCLLAEISRADDYFRATVCPKGVFSKLSLHYFCWLLFGIAALSRQTVSIHSSVVTVHGKSILFLGESGTGKSTQTGLWLKHLPDTELLNDDSPFIRVEPDGSIRVYGSPWSGKTPCYKNLHTPVAAFVRLSQAPHNRIRRLKGIEAIGALLPSCPFAFAYDKKLSESIYSIVSQALLQTPVYHLECLPDTDAVDLVYSTLIHDGVL